VDLETERRYGQLSPFELRSKLAELAAGSGHEVLNAARANPNWIALEPRQAFLQLGLFALEESARACLAPGFGAARLPGRLSEPFDGFAARQSGVPGIDFLRRCLELGEGRLGIAREELLQELAGAALGDHYPTPPRMLPLCERIVRAFLLQELLEPCADARFDLFAVEGATAGVAYLFHSLFESGLLAKGDRVALGTPIFAPYLELPLLDDYALVEIKIRQDEARGWHYPETELAKLRDPAIRAFVLVNPSNPTGVSLDQRTLEALAALIRRDRPDLIVVTDDVYATFAPGFVSLAALVPQNAVLIYSCSKFWGTTGWRMAVVALHEDNVLDRRIRAMPPADHELARRRYASIAVDPGRLKFIDRMVADSRSVGFNHTAGLSTPQQAQMALCALQVLMDDAEDYAGRARTLVRRRFESLYAGAGLPMPHDACRTHYYATIDIPGLARLRHGEAFAAWLMASFPAIDFVTRLAEQRGIVLLDAGGFDAPPMSVRVSLANLTDDAYFRIGRGIGELLEDYHALWKHRFT